MKYSTALLAAGAGVASAFPSAPQMPRGEPASNPWKAPGSGDQRGPCPGLNTLANHGYVNRNGQGITVDMAVKAFKDAFNMGSDIISSAAGSALSVCEQVTGAQCSAFDLHQLNTPHTFEHDASFTRQDFNNGLGNNHDFNQEVFDSVLKVWQDTNIISYSYANAARLMRINACKSADQPGWFTESDGTQLTEVAFYMGTMGTPQDGNARKDWIQYWWTHERLPFELGWAPDQRPEHNQSTINTMINNIINSPAPPAPKAISSSSSVAVHSSTSVASSSTAASKPSTSEASKPSTTAAAGTPANKPSKAPVTLPIGYGVISTSSSIKIVPVSTSTPCTLPEGFTYTSVNPTSFIPVVQTTPAAVSSSSVSAGFSSFANSSSTAPLGTGSSASSTHSIVPDTTPTPVTTVFQTTSTVYATTEITVTSCAPEITNCPAESRTPMVITSTISSFTTICPVTATMIKSSGSLVPMTSAAPSSAPAATFTVPPQTVSYSVSQGIPVVVATSAAATSAPAAAVTTETPHSTMNIPNPYFTSVPAVVFPSVPVSIISQFSASTGAFAAPSYAPQYTESGSAAIASATAVNNPQAPASVAPSVPAAAKTTPAAIAYGTGAMPPKPTGSAPVQSIATGGSVQTGVSGLVAVAAALMAFL